MSTRSDLKTFFYTDTIIGIATNGMLLCYCGKFKVNKKNEAGTGE